MANMREMVTIVKRKVKEVGDRIQPEANAISVGLAVGSGPLLTVAQGAMTVGLHELLKGSDLSTVGLVAIGLVALGNAISFAVELKTLKEKGYSNNPISNGLYILTGSRVATALISHVYHLGLLAVANPAHAVNLPSMIGGDQGRLLMENTAAVSTALSLWNIGTNTLIRQGRIDPVVNSMKKVGASIKRAGSSMKERFKR